MTDEHDLGEPISYLVAPRGLAVLASDGAHVGELAHVLAAEDEDLFEGIVIRLDGVTQSHRFVDRDRVREFHERGVVLDVPPSAVPGLPEPTANPAALAATPDEEEGVLAARLRRAWDLLSGNY